MHEIGRHQSFGNVTDGDFKHAISIVHLAERVGTSDNGVVDDGLECDKLTGLCVKWAAIREGKGEFNRIRREHSSRDQL